LPRRPRRHAEEPLPAASAWARRSPDHPHTAGETRYEDGVIDLLLET
jgi:hypothetical protein